MQPRTGRPAPRIFTLFSLIFCCFLTLPFASCVIEEAWSMGTESLLGEFLGSIDILSYNIAGLPEGISASHPAANTAKIGPKLSTFTVAALQEDFAYHDSLQSSATLTYMTPHWAGGFFLLGDGLTIASRVPILCIRRVAWDKSNGVFDSANDSLTPKGFLLARLDLGGGEDLSFIDLHMDAGSAQGDIEARRDQAGQLAEFIGTLDGSPLVVAGDFNLSADRDEDVKIFEDLLINTGLIDSKPKDSGSKPIDKILYRPGGGITMEASDWTLDSGAFLDGEGKQLSDHIPVRVRFNLGRGAD